MTARAKRLLGVLIVLCLLQLGLSALAGWLVFERLDADAGEQAVDAWLSGR